MIRTFSILVSVMSVCLFSSGLRAANQAGDANNDQARDMTDAALVQSRLYGLATPAMISPLALTGNDTVFGVDDLMRVAQIATGSNPAPVEVAAPPNAFSMNPPANLTVPSGILPNPVLTFTVASTTAEATLVDGLALDAFSLGSATSTLANPSLFVAGGQASVELVAYNPGPGTDSFGVLASITYTNSAGVNPNFPGTFTLVDVTPPACGDGVAQAPEVCDDGDNGVCIGPCNPSCSGPSSVCGDSTVECAEACDDGNLVNGDGCEDTCVCSPGFTGPNCTLCAPGYYGPTCQPCPGPLGSPCYNNGFCSDGLAGSGFCACNMGYSGPACACGNSVTDPGEICDDGPGNGTGEGFCLHGCLGVQTCGDSVANGTEACDDGPGGSCLDDCSGYSICGDGMASGTEACDDGALNGTGEGYCLADCSAVQTCGDGAANGTEVCDDGGFNGAGEGYCLVDCSAVQYCGDGVTNGTEDCDAGTLAPVPAGGWDTPGNSIGVVVKGNYAYVADDTDGLRIIDVSTPSIPVEAGFFDTPGSAWDVAVCGTTAYVADSANGLVIIDVSAPPAPVALGGLATSNALGVDCAGTWVYVADAASGLLVIDAANPASPMLNSAYDTPGLARHVVLDGTTAYVADDTGGLQIIDVTFPPAPSLVGSNPLTGDAIDVDVQGTLAYVASYFNGLQIVDVSVPAAPVQVGAIGAGVTLGVDAVGSRAYVANYAGGLRVVDISIPSTPVEIGAYVPAVPEYYGVVAAGAYAYVTNYANGLDVLDVTEFCHMDCTATFCGDGAVSIGEACDDGPGGECFDDCLALNACGDMVVFGGEPCDDGPNNGMGEGFCLGDCSGVQFCGDNMANGTEICDDGALNGMPCLCDFGCQGYNALCGDGIACGLEQCDEGFNNGLPASGCDGACNNYCGNGITDFFEACDPSDTGWPSGSCSDDCEMVTCGDGTVQSPYEACDDGFNNGLPSSPCDAACQLKCGDGFADPAAGESCDPPDGLACDSLCQLANCGNGIVNAPIESCDDGPFNGMGGSLCDSGCQLLCGNSLVDPLAGEDCDPPDGLFCDDLCRSELCGDGVLNAPMEQCDDGPANGSFSSGCDFGCALRCGNGSIDSANEQCDPPDGLFCDNNCLAGFCGDGVLNPPLEECDDGNNNPGDGCDFACYLECGNGLIDPPSEQCDKAIDPFCADNCTYPMCGNGTVEAPFENCDDGNSNSGDGCDSQCQDECGNGSIDGPGECEPPDGIACTLDCRFPNCGNLVVDAPFERCDDGNRRDGDGCDMNCDIECGNGQPDPGEQCDWLTNPFCSTDCNFPVCGNFVVDAPFENCDDGNTQPFDGCDSACQDECGDGMVNFPFETCDPPSAMFMCDPTCHQADCGDGLVQSPWEECDSGYGNGDPGDPCDASCQLRCGNGFPEPGEECDPPDGMTCTPDCKMADCGNGRIESPIENCDDGTPFTMAVNCQCSTTDDCGNGFIDPGETCEPPDGFTCTASCQFANCGDGVVQAPIEECDDGNFFNGDGCDTQCLLECGNGFIEPGEDCDPPDGLTCSAACQSANCGDFVVDAPMEECDEGAFNGLPGSACDFNCQPFCGNGSIDPPLEDCELPGQFNCGEQCQYAICGDGVVQAPFEECDDGNTFDFDGCDSYCLVECGNGFIDPGEECEPPLAYGCSAGCLQSQCGNGRLESPQEACDDGSYNGMPSSACDSGCNWKCGNGNVDDPWECEPPGQFGCPLNCRIGFYCGDGILDAPYEACDDGNTLSGDGCDPACNPECGNGYMDPGEDCDPPDYPFCSNECLFSACGNGRLETPGEQCDDGNMISGDGCDSGCRHECGNGMMDPAEQCDPPLLAGCSAACQFPACGDGRLDAPQEDCDLGPANGYPYSGCDFACQSYCGNGFMDPGEECDPAGVPPTPDCTADCRLAACGNGRLEAQFEHCDEGADNGMPWSGCDSSCRLRCGDGNVNPGAGEECDPPDGAFCDRNCKFMVCGNGTVNPESEQCDAGGLNGFIGQPCDGNCLDLCGNYSVDLLAGEECDPPAPGVCSEDCRQVQCGNFRTEGPDEECDSGFYNGWVMDPCDVNCEWKCGNGVTDFPLEQCDPAEPFIVFPCSEACRYPFCGDGIVDAPFETCDDGNNNPGDGCDPLCFAECGNGVADFPLEQCDPPLVGGCSEQCLIPFCGDGVLDAPWETCDDGNVAPGDGCDGQCRLECGNGNVDYAGECEPPNGLGCPFNCRQGAVCGDGVLDPPFEACDDGNTTGGDGCAPWCDWECGNAVVDAGETCEPPSTFGCTDMCLVANCQDGVLDSPQEQCDDANANSGDGCDPGCVCECPAVLPECIPLCP